MNGEIGVESVVGLGSNFWFTVTFPLAQEQDVPRFNDTKFAKLFKGRVLVVEDQIVNQRVAQNYLRKLGLDVEIAGNGLVAFEKCQTEKYDVIFMDCQMPVLNGFEATARIRQFEEGRGQRTPIVALTAEAGSGERNLYADLGMDDYLAKPLELNHLLEVLQRWLPPVEQAIDVGALTQLESYVVQDQGLVAALVKDLEESAPGLIASMHEAFKKLDLTGISESAHALKSAAATLGAKKLAELCAALESLEEVSGAADFIAQIDAEFEACIQELKAYVDEKKVA